MGMRVECSGNFFPLHSPFLFPLQSPFRAHIADKGHLIVTLLQFILEQRLQYCALQRATTYYNVLLRATTFCTVLQRTTTYYQVLLRTKMCNLSHNLLNRIHIVVIQGFELLRSFLCNLCGFEAWELILSARLVATN